MDYKGLMELTDNFRAIAEKQLWFIKESEINGSGLHARIFILKGAKIGMTVTSNAGRITYMGSQINHQFKCNAKLMENKIEGCDLIAIKDIPQGEEITCNYKDTPWYIDKNTKGFVELE